MAFDKIVDSVSLDAKLSNIANAIRTGTGQSEAMTDEEMPFAISEIDTSCYGKMPTYWEDSVNTTISTIRNLQSDPNNIPLFAYFSDCHIRPNATTPNPCNTGILSAMVMNACQIPFAMCCGDSARSDGNGLTEESQMVDCFTAANNNFAPIGWYRLLQTQGNHDGSWGTVNGKAYAYQMNSAQLYDYIYRKQKATNNHVFGGGDNSYFYVDDTDNKIRIIMLNSLWCEMPYNADGTSAFDRQHYFGYGQAQLDWLANTALNVGSDWIIFIGTHIPPLDMYRGTSYQEYRTKWTRDIELLRGILSAYENKTTYSGSYTKNTSRGEGDWANVSVSVNFTNALGRIAGFYCGHCHVDTINTTDLPFPVITITADGNIPYDSTEETRVIGTDNEHAIDFVTINKVAQSVTLTRLGVGTSRSYSYKGVTLYSINNNLSNFTSSNSETSVEEGTEYTATLVAKEGCKYTNVYITMGGVDITSTAYSNGVVNIAEVTGDVVITAIAASYLNQIPISTDTNGSIYNGVGYATGYRINSSGNVVEYSTTPTVSVTGFIPFVAGDIIRLKNCYIDQSHAGAGSVQVAWYDANRTRINGCAWNALTNTYGIVEDADGHIIQFTNWNGAETTTEGIAYVRLTIVATSDNPIITINEDFDGNTDIVYSITNNLTNIVTNNNVSSVYGGGSYNATLMASSGYEIKTVAITMGGTDVTSTVYNNGVISVANVTGDIIITATAALSSVSGSYTNLADPTSADWSNDDRLSSSATNKGSGTNPGHVVTNWIDCVQGDIIRIKGVNILDGTSGYVVHHTTTNTAVKCSSFTSHFTTDSNGVISCTVATWVAANTQPNITKLRFSGKLTAADASQVIITKNEEIV